MKFRLIYFIILFNLVSIRLIYSQDYPSGEFSFSGNDLTFIPITITDAGTINDLNIMVNLDHENPDGLRELTLQLLSPYGNSVELAHGDQNGGSPYWGGQDGGNLYNTVFDDESSTLIYDGTAPFAGALCVITFTASSPGTFPLSISAGSVFRDKDNNNIPVNETANGMVVVE